MNYHIMEVAKSNYYKHIPRCEAGGHQGLSLHQDHQCQQDSCHHQHKHYQNRNQNQPHHNYAKMLSITINYRVIFLYACISNDWLNKDCQNWRQLRGQGLDLSPPGSSCWTGIHARARPRPDFRLCYLLAWKGANWPGASAMFCRRLSSRHCPHKRKENQSIRDGLIKGLFGMFGLDPFHVLASFDRFGPNNHLYLDGG